MPMRRRVLAQSTERPHSCMPDIFIRVMESFDNSPHSFDNSRRVRRRVLAQSTERLLSSTPHDVVITSFVADTPGGAQRHESVGGDW
ncbi:hypothetical protein NFJ02_42g109210 [Pycnococcus provasolii]